MPPKRTTAKAAAPAANGETGGEVKFAWTPENDRALMILCFGRNPTTEDYQNIVDAMPGTNYNGVKIRCSKLRMEMKKRYEDLGKEVPTLPAAKGKEPAGAKKRKGSEAASGEEGAEAATPSKAKKARATKAEKRSFKSEETVEEKDDEADGDEAGGDEAGGAEAGGDEAGGHMKGEEGAVKEEVDAEA